MDNLGLVIAGYALTAVGLGSYVGSLLFRASRAKRRAAAVAARRAG